LVASNNYKSNMRTALRDWGVARKVLQAVRVPLSSPTSSSAEKLNKSVEGRDSLPDDPDFTKTLASLLRSETSDYALLTACHSVLSKYTGAVSGLLALDFEGTAYVALEWSNTSDKAVAYPLPPFLSETESNSRSDSAVTSSDSLPSSSGSSGPSLPRGMPRFAHTRKPRFLGRAVPSTAGSKLAFTPPESLRVGRSTRSFSTGDTSGEKGDGKSPRKLEGKVSLPGNRSYEKAGSYSLDSDGWVGPCAADGELSSCLGKTSMGAKVRSFNSSPPRLSPTDFPTTGKPSGLSVEIPVLSVSGPSMPDLSDDFCETGLKGSQSFTSGLQNQYVRRAPSRSGFTAGYLGGGGKWREFMDTDVHLNSTSGGAIARAWDSPQAGKRVVSAVHPRQEVIPAPEPLFVEDAQISPQISSLVKSVYRYERCVLLEEGENIVVEVRPIYLDSVLSGVIYLNRSSAEEGRLLEGEGLDLFLQEVVAVTKRIRMNSGLVESFMALRAQRDKLIRNTKVQNEFVANTSHELRTPLNVMLGTLTLIQDTTLSGEQNELIELMAYSTKNLLAVISDVLDYQKCKEEGMELQLQQFDLQNIMHSLVQSIAYSRQTESNVEVTLLIDKSVPTNSYFVGDGQKLEQILLNLLSNAAKFTRKGNIVCHVQRVPVTEKRIKSLLNVSIQDAARKLQTQNEGDPGGTGPTNELENLAFLEFSVMDSGIGITPSMKKKIFSPFVQADGSDRREHRGTGLGLSISQLLLHVMSTKDNTISVSSEVGVGSTFFFELAIPYNMKEEEASSLENLGKTSSCPIPMHMSLYVKNCSVLAFCRNSYTFKVIHNNCVAADVALLQIDSLEEMLEIISQYNNPNTALHSPEASLRMERAAKPSLGNSSGMENDLDDGGLVRHRSSAAVISGVDLAIESPLKDRSLYGFASPRVSSVFVVFNADKEGDQDVLVRVLNAVHAAGHYLIVCCPINLRTKFQKILHNSNVEKTTLLVRPLQSDAITAAMKRCINVTAISEKSKLLVLGGKQRDQFYGSSVRRVHSQPPGVVRSAGEDDKLTDDEGKSIPTSHSTERMCKVGVDDLLFKMSDDECSGGSLGACSKGFDGTGEQSSPPKSDLSPPKSDLSTPSSGLSPPSSGLSKSDQMAEQWDVGPSKSADFPAILRRPLPRVALRRTTSEASRPVLMVEDNVGNRIIQSKLLEKISFIPICAENGEKGLEEYLRNTEMDEIPYSAILMDIQMPVMDGYQATEAIRKVERERGLRHTCIVALTASSDTRNNANLYRDLGMCAAVSKPVNLAQLRRTLTKIVTEGCEHDAHAKVK